MGDLWSTPSREGPKVRPWLVAGIGLAAVASLGVGLTLFIHDRLPTVGRLELALDRVEPPRESVLLRSESTDTCFAPCPAVIRWYAVPAKPDTAIAGYGKALTDAGFTYNKPIGPRTLATWTGYGARVSLQAHPGMDDSYIPPEVPQPPPGQNYLIVQAFKD